MSVGRSVRSTVLAAILACQAVAQAQLPPTFHFPRDAAAYKAYSERARTLPNLGQRFPERFPLMRERWNTFTSDGTFDAAADSSDTDSSGTDAAAWVERVGAHPVVQDAVYRKAARHWGDAYWLDVYERSTQLDLPAIQPKRYKDALELLRAVLSKDARDTRDGSLGTGRSSR